MLPVSSINYDCGSYTFLLNLMPRFKNLLPYCIDGQKAIRTAVSEEHFKVLCELVKRGADTTALTMYNGDTPIHAALTVVLDRDKSKEAFIAFL